MQQSQWSQSFDVRKPVQRKIKRVFDIVVAGIALLVFAPVMVAEAAAIWITMGRPVLFRHVRPGKHERLIVVVKFRTMLPEVDQSGHSRLRSKRITPLGWMLRRTSLDELPQLWNVVKGDISLVGPRPLLTQYLPYYTDREHLRHSVRPGITGLAQITGRNLLNWNDRLELDVRYVEEWSLWLDVRILLRTCIKVIKSSGVVRDPDQEVALHRVRRALSAQPEAVRSFERYHDIAH